MFQIFAACANMQFAVELSYYLLIIAVIYVFTNLAEDGVNLCPQVLREFKHSWTWYVRR